MRRRAAGVGVGVQAGTQAGRWARRRTRGRATGARQAEHRRAGITAGRRWARTARAFWARGLALGCALGALSLFSIRFSTRYFS